MQFADGEEAGLKRTKVYCAGPLFNGSEREEMTRIADHLVEQGYDVYLPHRDGMEFRLVHEVLIRRGYEKARAGEFLHQAIFALDVFQLVVDCDAMVWNLNGRVPDEGAVSEAAMAWVLGKPLVAYSDDVRSLIEGRVNPLLIGLVQFHAVRAITDLAPALAEQIASMGIPATVPLPHYVRQAVQAGECLWKILKDAPEELDNEHIADCVVELFAADTSPTGGCSNHSTTVFAH